MDPVNQNNYVPFPTPIPQVEPVMSPTPAPNNKNKITIISLSVFGVLILAVGVFLYIQNLLLKNMLVKYQTPVASPTPMATNDPLAGWKIYVSPVDNYKFRFPQEWNPIKSSSSSGHQIVFQSSDGLFRLTGDAQNNLNPATGNPYNSLDEFIGLPYTVKSLSIDGQDAREPLPRAGSEDTFRVYFFSQDTKLILSLELLVGDGSGYDHRVTPEIIQIGSDVFDKILSTYNFVTGSSEGAVCGGVAGIKCPTNYTCQLLGNFPDAGGNCTKVSQQPIQ